MIRLPIVILRSPRPRKRGSAPGSHLRNQVREQLLTLFRNDRVLPLRSLEGLDDSKQPQNEASDVI
jgi:hypothetical protein